MQLRVPVSCVLDVTPQRSNATPFKLKPAPIIGKNGDLPDIEEGAGIQSDHHDSLKLLFTVSRQRKQCKLFTFNTYLCVFDLFIYKEQHVEY